MLTLAGLWLRWSLRLTALLALPVLVIRAQPYDDQALHTLLTPPPGCNAPCFMGMQPGVTTIWEALDLLGTHAWVADLGDYDWEHSKSPDGTVTILLEWAWSGAQPVVIDATRPGAAWVLDDRVVSIDIETRLRLGDIRLALGEAEYEQAVTVRNPKGDSYSLYAWYPRERVSMVVGENCPAGELIRSRVTMHWAVQPLALPNRDALRPVCN